MHSRIFFTPYIWMVLAACFDGTRSVLGEYHGVFGVYPHHVPGPPSPSLVPSHRVVAPQALLDTIPETRTDYRSRKLAMVASLSKNKTHSVC